MLVVVVSGVSEETLTSVWYHFAGDDSTSCTTKGCLYQSKALSVDQILDVLW